MQWKTYQQVWNLVWLKMLLVWCLNLGAVFLSLCVGDGERREELAPTHNSIKRRTKPPSQRTMVSQFFYNTNWKSQQSNKDHHHGSSNNISWLSYFVTTNTQLSPSLPTPACSSPHWCHPPPTEINHDPSSRGSLRAYRYAACHSKEPNPYPSLPDISEDYHVLPRVIRSRMHQPHRLATRTPSSRSRRARSEDWTTSNARSTCFPILVVLVLCPVRLFTKQVAYLVSGNGKLIGLLFCFNFIYCIANHS